MVICRVPLAAAMAATPPSPTRVGHMSVVYPTVSAITNIIPNNIAVQANQQPAKNLLYTLWRGAGVRPIPTIGVSDKIPANSAPILASGGSASTFEVMSSHVGCTSYHTMWGVIHVRHWCYSPPPWCLFEYVQTGPRLRLKKYSIWY